MKYKLNELDVTHDRPLGSLREQLTYITLMALVFFLIPLILTSFSQIIDYGWKTYMSFQVIVYFILIITLIFRKVIPYPVSATIIIVGLYTIGFDLFLTLGISSGGEIYFVFASILGALLFEGTVWLVFMILGVLIMIGLASASVLGYIPLTKVDIAHHNSLISSWISYISMYISASCVVIFSIKAIYFVLTKKNGELQGKNSDLSDTNTKLQELIKYKDSLEAEKELYLDKLKNVVDGTVKIIDVLVQEKDPSITGHQDKVAILSEAIARDLQLGKDTIDGLVIAAKIHDLGKIYVPTEILNKPEKVTEEEYSLIKTHVERGFALLNSIAFPWEIANIIRQHHERIDGTGYPFALRGKDIRLEAKIISVADTVEAMLSPRTYRKGLPLDAAIAEITKNSGTHFDPVVVEACIKVLKDQKILDKMISAN